MTETKTMSNLPALESRRDTFVPRHIGPSLADQKDMLQTLGCDTLDQLVTETVPASIRMTAPLNLPSAKSEQEVIERLREIAGQNRVLQSLIGCGYYGTVTPPVIQRNILENPGWYTQYTPYQAEISQGRLEALLNFQTMVCDLTGLPLSNSSMLDEATAAAEAMIMCLHTPKNKKTKFFVASDCHPQTMEVVKTRALPIGIEIVEGEPTDADLSDGFFGVLIQYPNTLGTATDHTDFIAKAHEAGAQVVVATDLLALLCLKSPGEMGADIAVGSSQRFGVPMGYGGPHAAFLATEERFKRLMPGRIIGLSQDAHGRPALRLALQTREQHIRRAKATSNICTAQVLLAIMASMYAVYHGPDGLRQIAERVRRNTQTLARGLRDLGYSLVDGDFFDTLCVNCEDASADETLRLAELHGYNLRRINGEQVGISLDETTSLEDVDQLLRIFAGDRAIKTSAAEMYDKLNEDRSAANESLGSLTRTSDVLTHPVFHKYHSEHELLRYLNRLQSRDLSLTTSMIPLGSCTMKLNATAEMLAITWPEFGAIHPHAPSSQTIGYQVLFRELEAWLAEITGFAATSLQPNAGSQGEYSGLLLIRAFHEASGNAHRKICIIPDSAHGTNPASAVMAGYKVVAVRCDKIGNIDVDHLREKAEEHRDELAALMITYPSTHGVFEETIKDICTIIHDNGGQVYMDGANMNAQVGLCRPGDIGADVCHLNLHKTFCIPHGGGGPGVGPICVADHLEPFLPGDPLDRNREQSIGPVAAATYGSASILPISWAYIALMGCDGLLEASQVAILNANYMATRLDGPFKILYRGKKNRVAHEFILDVRPFKTSADIGVDDIAKRMIDYRYHAPTMSWPVPGTLMIEPTESESREELDRFCDATLSIRKEIEEIETGTADREDNVLRNSPHTAHEVTSDSWTHPYGREKAAYPLEYLRDFKFWPAVSRVDNTFGDRNLVCSCPPMDAYTDD